MVHVVYFSMVLDLRGCIISMVNLKRNPGRETPAGTMIRQYTCTKERPLTKNKDKQKKKRQKTEINPMSIGN